MMRIKRYRFGVLALGGLLAVAGVGVASGAIPSSSDGVIHGCYQKPGLLANPGAVRVIDAEAGQTCRSNETAFQWNGSAPFSGRVIVEETRTVPGGGDNATAIATCPPGKVVLNGGAELRRPHPRAAIIDRSVPNSSLGWAASAIEITPTNEEWTLEVTAVCVDG